MTKDFYNALLVILTVLGFNSYNLAILLLLWQIDVLTLQFVEVSYLVYNYC